MSYDHPVIRKHQPQTRRGAGLSLYEHRLPGPEIQHWVRMWCDFTPETTVTRCPLVVHMHLVRWATTRETPRLRIMTLVERSSLAGLDCPG